MDGRRLTHETAREALPALALGVLDPDDAVGLAAHLAECALCQDELRQLEELLGVLGTAVPLSSPPAGLRDQILAQAAGTASAPPLQALRLRSLPAWTRVALAAAAVLVLLLTGAVGVLLYRLGQIEREFSALRAEQREIASVLAHSTWWAPVTMEGAPGDAVVGRLYLQEGQTGVLVIDGLEPLAPDRVYQVWLIRADETRVSAGVFTVDAERRATLVLHAPGTWTAYQGMGITVEPGPDGSPGPTSPRVAGCSLADWQPDGL